MRPLTILQPARQLLHPPFAGQNVLIPLHKVPRRANSTTTTITDPGSSSSSSSSSSPLAPPPDTDLPAIALPGTPIPQDIAQQAATLLLEQRQEAAIKEGDDSLLFGPNEQHLIDRQVRYPRAVQALYLQPLRRVPKDGVPCCDLQLRSFSVRNLEFFADFSLRAAYYLKLPAFGAHPLPRITEKWTVPKSHFIFKKIQENFARITHRRLIQIKDGHPESIKLWLAFLRKHQYHGVGMKANVWEWSSLNVAREMDANVKENDGKIGAAWSHIGDTKQIKTVEKVAELLSQERFKLTGGR